MVRSTDAMVQNVKKKYAFISYSHKDEKVAKWLQHKLESYRLPAEIHNECEKSRYLRPVFRDRSDLNTGILSDELRINLESSKFLIVICSPESAASTWVSDEVSAFINTERLEYIIPFIVDGTPNSGDATECFPSSLCEYTRKHPDKVLLGIDIREDSREKAFIRLVSRMLGLTFDELWKRHERQRRNNIICVTLASLLLSICLYWFAVPVSLKVRLTDIPSNLPTMRSAKLQVADQEYSIAGADTAITLTRPGHWRGRNIPVTFDAIYYQSIDTLVNLGIGRTSGIVLHLKRDETFSVFAGMVIDDDGNPVFNACVTVDDEFVSYTDADGHFHVDIPLQKQSLYKHVSVTKDGYMDFVRDEESPSSKIVYLLRK